MRPIDADALLEAIKTDVMGGLNYRHFIEKSPTIESKQGEWIDLKTMDEWYTHVYKCSLCGYEHMYSNYCPNCGAKMKGADDE